MAFLPRGASPLQTDEHYTGSESAIPESAIRQARSNDFFQVTRQPLPPGAKPIVDADQSTTIGYTLRVEGNTWVCDPDGRTVDIHEPGLGTPLIDPVDLVFIVGSLGRVAVRGIIRAGAEAAGDLAAKAAAETLAEATVSTLRVAFRRLVQKELKFTATTAARMADPGRFIPVNILKLAVRYGVRDADPERVAGVYRYTIPMFRASKTVSEPAKKYLLRVIVRERDWTILHFHAERFR